MKLYILIASLLVITSCGSDDSKTSNEFSTPDGFTLVWNDEFEQAGIDQRKWVFETGNGTDYGLAPGWGNSEKQIYTQAPSNASVQIDESDNSVLAITALSSGSGYTSAKITTQELLSVRYGKIEARVKLPTGRGLWPAFWMLGDNINEIDWPGCGEIDVFELLGHAPATIHNNVHYTNNENKHEELLGAYTLANSIFADDYHKFTLDWTPESLIYSIDDQQVHQITIEDDMKEFHRGMYLIFNVAVGGNWPGDPDETTTFPQSMYVDYVRVYSQNDLQISEPPVLEIEEETLGQFVSPEIAGLAIATDYTAFGALVIDSWGGGGEPEIEESADAVDGDKSIKLIYPGENWGGSFFEMEEDKDFTSYANGTLYFSIKHDEGLNDAEIKLESPAQASSAAVFIADYTAEDLGEGWVRYSIPMSDFEGLDLSELRIPFAMWNPKDANDEFFVGSVLVDDVHID